MWARVRPAVEVAPAAVDTVAAVYVMRGAFERHHPQTGLVVSAAQGVGGVASGFGDWTDRSCMRPSTTSPARPDAG